MRRGTQTNMAVAALLLNSLILSCNSDRDDMEGATRARVNALAIQLTDDEERGVRCQDQAAVYHDAGRVLDAWGTEVRIVCSTEGGLLDVVSAGKDGKFGTGDDRHARSLVTNADGQASSGNGK